MIEADLLKQLVDAGVSVPGAALVFFLWRLDRRLYHFEKYLEGKFRE